MARTPARRAVDDHQSPLGDGQLLSLIHILIILNALFFLAEMVLPAGAGDWMIRHLGLFYWGSGNFQPLQLLSLIHI